MRHQKCSNIRRNAAFTNNQLTHTKKHYVQKRTSFNSIFFSIASIQPSYAYIYEEIIILMKTVEEAS
jgi:hypothetical protein